MMVPVAATEKQEVDSEGKGSKAVISSQRSGKENIQLPSVFWGRRKKIS